MFKRLLLLSLLVGLSFQGFVAEAQTLTLYTESDAPYNFQMADGKPAGLAVEVVQDIQRRLGTNEPMNFVPWARAYDTGIRQANVVVFTMARTVERNSLFHWVGPINENSWILVARADSKTKLGGLDDARQLHRIGVYREDARDQYLTQLGFMNLERSLSNTNLLKMLSAGRVDAVAMADATVADALKEADLRPSDVRELLNFKTVQVYIAMSNATPKESVESWTNAFAAMQKDGSFKAIYSKYFPRKKLPGPAVDPH